MEGPSHHATSIMTWPDPGCNERVESGVMRAVKSPGLDRPRATGKLVDVAFPAGSATPDDIGPLRSRTRVGMFVSAVVSLAARHRDGVSWSINREEPFPSRPRAKGAVSK